MNSFHRSPRLLSKRRSSSSMSQMDSGSLVFAGFALFATGLFVMTCLVLHRHLSSSPLSSTLSLRRTHLTPSHSSSFTTTTLPVRYSMTPPADVPYDIYHCPDTPPPHYPYEWNLLQVLDHWPIDTTAVPAYWHQGLCVWDARIHTQQIETYLKAEVPFVLQHHPDVLATAQRWSTPGYLHHSNNQFLFWRPLSFMRQIPKSTIDHVDLTFAEWYDKAQALQTTSEPQATQEHWYFRINGIQRMQENLFLYDELPYFHPQKSWFMVEPEQERGINCRFGMKGAFAASHFDPTRNWITLLGGTRRYLLSNYTQCSHLQLYPIDHPSQRHSMVDWSRPRQYLQEHPETQGFAQATVNEVVLQAGDALYLPTSWFHAIVSLDINYQCNARSGVTPESFPTLRECGFGN